MQDYNIDLIEWIKHNSTRKFLSLLANLSQNTILVQRLQDEALKKDKSFKKLTNKNTSQEYKFDLKNKNSVSQMHNIFKSFSKEK